MKFVQNNKILEDSNAENAEISAEKTKSKPKTSSAPPQGQPFLRLSYVFSALISAFSASLR